MAVVMPNSPKFHAAMYPFFAYGNMIPYLQLANELAERGHKVTLFLPRKPQSRLQSLNLHPDLISFHTIIMPHLDGLPPGTETASDVPVVLNHLFMTAMAHTADQVEDALRVSKPDFLFYDFCHWVPLLGSRLGIKNIFYDPISAVSTAYMSPRGVGKARPLTAAELAVPPPGYPSSTVVFDYREARSLLGIYAAYAGSISLYERSIISWKESDAIAIRTCKEIDGKYCDYVAAQHRKPVLLTGPVLPEASADTLGERWAQWLDGFNPGSVIVCIFGSLHAHRKDQFQELVLGLELTGLPFLAFLQPPIGAATVEEALPVGFKERVRGKGVVHGGWVEQQSILSHPSVGCFVNHCGFATMWESLVIDCQLVLAPNFFDHRFNAKLLSKELEVAVEVERDEERSEWFSKESLCKAIKSVMDEDSEVGRRLRKNHAKLKETLLAPGFMSSYVDRFIAQLQELLDHN